MARDGYCHEAAVPAAAHGRLRRSGTRSPACAPSPQCWHFFFFFPLGGVGKPTNTGKVPPPWRPPRGRSGCLAPVRVLLGFPHQPAGMQVPGGTLGCRKAAGGGPGSPPTWARGQGQPGGLPGSWQGRSSLPREEEEELSSLTACSQISPLLLLIPPRKPGWALFSSPPPPNFFKMQLFPSKSG